MNIPLVGKGVDLYTVKNLLGHATMKMTERYSHLGNERLQAAVAVLDEATTRRQGNNDNAAAKVEALDA